MHARDLDPGGGGEPAVFRPARLRGHVFLAHCRRACAQAAGEGLSRQAGDAVAGSGRALTARAMARSLCAASAAGLSLERTAAIFSRRRPWSIGVNIAGSKPTAAMPARVEGADLTVIGGAGHVGVPLVLAFAEAGCRVNVHDLNRDALAILRSGRLPFIEHGG